MIPEKSRPKLGFYALILILLFFGLIHILFKGHGTYLRLELMGVVLLVFLTVLSFFNYHKTWGEHLLFFVFLFYIVNLILIWVYNSSFYFILFFLSLVGFLMSIPHKHLEKKVEVLSNIPPSKEKSSAEKKSKEISVRNEPKNEPHSMIFEETEPTKSSDINSLKSNAIKKAASKKTTAEFSPGKYLASNRSNVYHEAKCEWANNINPKNRVWFQAKEDAWEKGYKSHDCVK